MRKLVLILIFSFCIFIACLIVFTRKEEAEERKLIKDKNYVNGYLNRVERIGKSISKGEMTFTYSAYYLYEVNHSKYKIKVLYEVKSDCLDSFPERINVYYDCKNPKKSTIMIKFEHNKMAVKERVKSLVPSICISVTIGILLIQFFMIH